MQQSHLFRKKWVTPTHNLIMLKIANTWVCMDKIFCNGKQIIKHPKTLIPSLGAQNPIKGKISRGKPKGDQVMHI
jgi:hypothetical protein